MSTGESLRERCAPSLRRVLANGLTLAPAPAQDKTPDKTYVMKISLPSINDIPHHFAKNFAAAVEKDSGGRIKPEVYPASQLDLMPREIEGTQFGAIQAVTIPPEFIVGQCLVNLVAVQQCNCTRDEHSPPRPIKFSVIARASGGESVPCQGA